MATPFGQYIKIPDEKDFWITSDHHFFHQNIIKYCNRPFKDWCEMNTIMTEEWFNVVKEDDIVFHLGDIFCGCGVVGVSTQEAIEFWNSLPGKKILIKGNHDERLVNKVPMFVDADDEVNVKNFLIVKWRNKELYLCHRPLDWKNINAGGICADKYMIHGHTHNYKFPEEWNIFNVSVDVNNWTPVLASSIIKH